MKKVIYALLLASTMALADDIVVKTGKTVIIPPSETTTTVTCSSGANAVCTCYDPESVHNGGPYLEVTFVTDDGKVSQTRHSTETMNDCKKVLEQSPLCYRHF